MAFKFSRSSGHIADKLKISPAGDNVSRESGLANSQLAKSNNVYPPWLKVGTSLKQMPGIYQGVLGQVQLQTSLLHPGKKLIKQANGDYMDRFTDTERVHQLLSASRLSNEVLATIWAHVNKTFPGRLTNREVCLALAIIAEFQQLETPAAEKSKDPFSTVRLQKRPPVPKLYPGDCNSVNKCESSKRTLEIHSSKSTPEELCSINLLVNLDDGEGSHKPPNRYSRESATVNQANTDFGSLNINLIDDDYYEFGKELANLAEIWLKFLNGIRVVYKRSYDILNVENSRQSALEALRSQDGKEFSMYLCLSYPLAHNIKTKIDELYSLEVITQVPLKSKPTSRLFDKRYITKINDLMNSVNEYWAVLINLFNESGQTKFIELIMDGLKTEDNSGQERFIKRTVDQLVNELKGLNRPDLCSICYSKFYLTTSFTSLSEFLGDKSELVLYQEPISGDNQYYYHPKCANFWLNHVCADSLPLTGRHDESILVPGVNKIDFGNSLI